MRFDLEDTICAIATGHESGLRGCVRIAGRSTLSILDEVQSIRDRLRSANRPTRFPIQWDCRSKLGSIPVDLWYWPTHRSYTGLPSAELHTIGNQVILNRIVEQLGEAGTRLARPGEFTLRAFLAGRMDLTQCEAVLGVIEADSQKMLEVGLKQLAGGLSIPLAKIRSSLIDLLADLEAGLDFVDEGIEFISHHDLIERLTSINSDLEQLRSQLDQRQSSQHTPQIVLLGLPNAGKSSLMNALTREEASIVDSQAGTTRDFVRIRRKLKNGFVEFIDTAGIETSAASDSIESISQNHTQQQRDQADLILYCIDSQLDADSKRTQIQEVHNISRHSPVWLIETKSDLVKLNEQIEGWNDHRSSLAQLSISLRSEEMISISCGRHMEVGCYGGGYGGRHMECACYFGVEDLLDRIDKWLKGRDIELAAVAPMTIARCRNSVIATAEALQAGLDAADQSLGDEIVAGEMRLALDQLAEVAGQVYTDDVLDALFSRFCIGK